MDEPRVLATQFACQRARGARQRAAGAAGSGSRINYLGAALATTEAVANAVEHGEACEPRGIDLSLGGANGTIGIEVWTAVLPQGASLAET